MGVDFITSCAKNFKKSWDRGLRELSQPSLFTGLARERRQLFFAVPRNGSTFQQGRAYEIAIENSAAVVKDGVDTIGDFPDLPQFALNEMHNRGCDAAVGYVHRVHEISGVADMTIR